MRAAAAMVARIDLPAVADALRDAAADPEAEAIWAEPPDQDAARRMVEGYAAVDALLADGPDPLALGGSAALLELNHIVLCGMSEANRRTFAAHIAATDRRFYDDHEAGADTFYAWLALQSAGPPDRLAAQIWARIVSRPQLFIEGNQRTATLLASLVLLRGDLPPMVASRRAAVACAALGERCRSIDRASWRGRIDFALGWRAARSVMRGTADTTFIMRSGVAVTA